MAFFDPRVVRTRQPYKDQAKYLAGPIALLKMHTTRSAQQTATDAVQLFGGRGTCTSVSPNLPCGSVFIICLMNVKGSPHPDLAGLSRHIIGQFPLMPLLEGVSRDISYWLT